jgi:hypothetical protein
VSETVDHRRIAVRTYNAAWQLLEADRSPAEDLDLLALAMTSRYHWGLAGGPREAAVADWMVSRCCAAVGAGPLSVSYADAALSRADETTPAWLRASLHEGRARAAAAVHDEAGREQHVALAREELARETDAEDRAVIEEQLADLT